MKELWNKKIGLLFSFLPLPLPQNTSSQLFYYWPCVHAFNQRHIPNRNVTKDPPQQYCEELGNKIFENADHRERGYFTVKDMSLHFRKQDECQRAFSIFDQVCCCSYVILIFNQSFVFWGHVWYERLFSNRIDITIITAIYFLYWRCN